MNEDAGRDCATPASVRHDDDEPRRCWRWPRVVKRRQDDLRSTITDAVSNSF
jgi:hypothetical protein